MTLLIGATALHLGWPQALFLFMMIVSDAISLRKHGQPRDETYSFPISVIATVVGIAILFWGGFFTEAGR